MVGGSGRANVPRMGTVGLILLAAVVALGVSVLIGLMLVGSDVRLWVAGALTLLLVAGALWLMVAPAHAGGVECFPPFDGMVNGVAGDEISSPACLAASRLRVLVALAVSMLTAAAWWVAWSRSRRRAPTM